MGVTGFAKSIRWHLRALGPNPLVRVSDRLEALVALAVLATALFAIPLAAQAGEQVYESGARTAHEQTTSRHSVDAVAVDGRASSQADYYAPSYVRAQWRDGSQLHTEMVMSDAPVQAGDPMKIWLDDAGKVVAAPLTPEDAELSGVGAGFGVWVVIVTFGALMAFGIRRGLDRSRDRAWERELHLLAHNDDGWANRRT